MPSGPDVGLTFRRAFDSDAPLLAAFNRDLIRDEGHRNRMSLAQLEERMRGWLAGEYEAILVLQADQPLGYALFRHDEDAVYLRQFFVVSTSRRRGVGRAAIDWLRRHVGDGAARWRLDVLMGNETGRAFWKSVGFREYCVTMELDPS